MGAAAVDLSSGDVDADAPFAEADIARRVTRNPDGRPRDIDIEVPECAKAAAAADRERARLTRMAQSAFESEADERAYGQGTNVRWSCRS